MGVEMFIAELVLATVFALVWALAVSIYVILPVLVMYFTYRVIRLVKNGH